MKRNSLLSVLFIALVWMQTGCADQQDQAAGADNNEDISWAFAIHGGAGAISPDVDDEVRDAYLEALEVALQAGKDILEQGGSGLDAVEAAVNIMEDDSLFNAGRGAVFTADGGHELDASIMDGSTLNVGAITGVRTVKNPITLARKVKTESRHVFFSTDGAERFADFFDDLERVEQDYFFTQRRYNALQRAQQRQEQSSLHEEENFDMGTVGAVALDQNGNLAAATSTGGMTNKEFGRIGDSPIAGAATYADNNSCAVSTTGHGEKFIMNAVAYQICAAMEYGGHTLEEAADIVVNQKLDPEDGGIISVDKDGNIVLEFSTRGMYRGAANSAGKFEVSIWD